MEDMGGLVSPSFEVPRHRGVGHPQRKGASSPIRCTLRYSEKVSDSGVLPVSIYSAPQLMAVTLERTESTDAGAGEVS